MSLLNLPKCKCRKFDSTIDEIFCDKYKCIKLVEDCIACNLEIK